MSAGRTGKLSGATRSSSKRHPHTRFPLLPEIGLLKERTLGKPDVRAPAVLEALAPRPRGGTVDTADLKSAPTLGVRVRVPARPPLTSAMFSAGSSSLRNTAKVALTMPAPTRATSG